MRKTLVVLSASLAAGGLVGYYIGYDVGFERAAQETVQESSSSSFSSSALPVPALPPPETEPETIDCTKEYVPVCGKIQVQCITVPCDPVDTTFANRCLAVQAGATEIKEGICE